MKKANLSDEFILNEAIRINNNLENLNIPFGLVCGRKAKNKISSSWRKYTNSCVPGVVNARWISENELIKYLSKNNLPSLQQLKTKDFGKKETKKIDLLPVKINIPEKKEVKPQPIKAKKTDLETKKISGSGYKFVTGEATEIFTQAETLNGKYGLMEIDDLIPSHNWENFSKNPKYPDGCQERNYHTSKSEQAKIYEYATKLNPKFLITEDPTAENGSPVVTKDGIVLGGNKRTMSLQYAKHNVKTRFADYSKLLSERLSIFGLNKSQFDKFKYPVLVRIVDVDLNNCSHFSWILNTSKRSEVSAEERAAALSKEFDNQTIKRLGMFLEESEAETYSEAMKSTKLVNQIQDLLTNKKIINSGNLQFWYKQGTKEFTDSAKDILQNILLGAVFSNLNQIKEATDYLNNKVLKALPYFLRLKAIKGKWNLLKYFSGAMKLELERRKTNDKKADFVNQTAIGREKIDENILLAWDILELPWVQFKAVIKNLTEAAEQQSNNENNDAMFEVDQIGPEQVLKSYLKRAATLEDGTKKKSIFSRLTIIDNKYKGKKHGKINSKRN